MKLTVERMPESQVLLDIAADEDEFNKAMDRAFRKVSQQIAVPGFRPGKAPRGMVERLYGREVILHEANHELMDKLYREALQQEELVPVGEPDNIEIVEEEPLNFKVTVPVYPAVDPGDYQSVRVEPADAAMDESKVEDVLERIRKSQSPWVDPDPARPPREGDQITIDLEVKEGDEEFDQPVEDATFVLGESNLFDELRAEVEQLNVAESATFEITFAEDDEKVSDRVRGKTLTYTVTLKGLKERQLVELDDALAKEAADVETIAELRADIRTDVHRARTEEARSEVLNQIINAMAESATFELPPVMVEDALTEEVSGLRQRLAQQRTSLEEYLRLQNQTEEELKEELRPNTIRRLRNSLLLREIAKREEINISDEDVDSEIDSLTSGADNADRLRELYQQGYFRGMLRNDLYDRRLTDRIIALATDGQGAVLNGWVAPEQDGKDAESLPSRETEGSERGDGAGGEETEDAAVSVEDVAQEPDVEQAASVGHEEEQAAVEATAEKEEASR
ncbi:MAG: trigger factor [Thermomicrobiales bacterium]